MFYSEKNEIDMGAPNARVGTRRYMAPEAVSNRMNLKDFDSYKHADVYSFGLVMWEICRRTMTGNEHTVSTQHFFVCLLLTFVFTT